MLRFMKITAFVFTISILGVFLYFQHFLSEHILWGVKVNDISIGGLTTGEAEERLEILADRLENRTLNYLPQCIFERSCAFFDKSGIF